MRKSLMVLAAVVAIAACVTYEVRCSIPVANHVTPSVLNESTVGDMGNLQTEATGNHLGTGRALTIDIGQGTGPVVKLAKGDDEEEDKEDEEKDKDEGVDRLWDSAMLG